MKQTKKIIAMVLVAIMAFTLVACGDGDTSDGGEAVFKIGGIGPTTGAASVYGVAVMNGAEIAVEEINEAGGINGTPIEFSFQDDEHDPVNAVNAYNTLMDWGMDLLMGTVTSGPSIAVSSEAANDGMYMLTPSGSSPDIIDGKTNVFQVCFTDPNQGMASAQYIGDNNIATKIGILYDSSDVYSTGIYEEFVAEATNHGFEIVSTEAFTADTKTDFTVQLQKAKSAGAELMFLPFYANEASLVLTQADSMDFSPIFFGCDGMDGILSVENFNTDLAEGLSLLTPFVATSDDDATVSFVSKYEELHGETPNQFAADAYDAIYIIKEAIEASGATADMEPADISAAVIGAMVEISYEGLTGSMTWSETGEVSKDPKAMTIKDGIYVDFMVQ